MADLSFEFFPPNTNRGRSALARAAGELDAFSPAFYSVTYGAGGSTRERTFQTVAALRDAGFKVARIQQHIGKRHSVLGVIPGDPVRPPSPPRAVAVP